ncbi:unnamed protein product, partial [Adineta steineri]
MVTGLKYN